ncbi:AAA family ATPase [Streptomyces sp. NBC_00038]|uniref:AAA family ATPase n=1 Tax=Streptomyces sp. NBC_00038 TaxID=2903615 RepID=UPI002258541A|nr:LuxR family transcriptional regulator [Streptomyces sp. NBC_00038]MCX5554579.1 LuxR C-terminal-related transcriptional regulator [Streptomyces sp. NBC_00038]
MDQLLNTGLRRQDGFPLRGRQDLISVVSRVLKYSMGTGQSAAVVLSGEEGIGKTALTDAAAREAARIGFAVGHGRSDSAVLSSQLPALVWALRTGQHPLVPAELFAELASVYERPPWLLDRISDLLETTATRQPVLMALEDVHWADELTAAALRVLPERLIGHRVVWLVSTRDTVTGPMSRTLAEITRQLPSKTIAVPPLPTDAMLQIACDRLDGDPGPALRALLEGAGGNPLIAVELAEAAYGLDADTEPPIPKRLVARSGEQLRSLPEAAARLVTTGSVLGTSFTPGAVSALLDGLPGKTVLPELAEVTRVGLLIDDGERISFRSEVQRRAIYETLPPSIRAALHSKALHVAGSDPVACAPHLLAGARPGDFAAATTLVDAAERTRGSAPNDAARLVTRAIELVGPEVPEWTELAARAVGVLAETGHDREAIALTDRVIARAPATAVLVRAEVSIAMPLWRLGLLETMRSRAWQILGSTDLSERDRARLIAVAMLADSRSGDVETARAAVDKVLADARRAGDDEGERLARWASAEVAGLEGRYPVSGDLLGCSADLESAWKSAQAKLAALPEDRLAAGNLRVRLAWIAFLRGDLRALEKQVRLAQRLPLDEDPAWPTALLMLQTVLAVAREDSRAVDLARQVDQDGAVHRTRWLPEWQMLVARVARASGDSPLTRRSVSMARTFAERNSGLAVPAAVHAHITGLATNDLVELRQAVDTLRPVDRPLLLATALADYGEALLGAGSRAEGLAALDQAAGLYHELGAQGELRRLYPVVRAAGARRRWAPATHRPETGWGALTGAERRVADLVADGHSNKSAATELFLSPNTVATHLRAVFGKLGISSRLQLARLVTAQRERSHLD